MVVAAPAMMYAMYAMAAVSAVATISAAQRAAEANEANAAIARQRGEMAVQQAGAMADIQARNTKRQMAQAQANFAAAGIEPQGSPLDVLSDQAQEGALAKQMIIYRGTLGQWQSNADAAGFDRAAGNARTAGYFGAGQTLLTAGYLGANNFSPSTPAGSTGADQVGPAMSNISTGTGASPY